jgi:hypothetical protein
MTAKSMATMASVKLLCRKSPSIHTVTSTADDDVVVQGADS